MKTANIYFCWQCRRKDRDYSEYGLSQWGTTLHCNIDSHWLSPYPEWSQFGSWYQMRYKGYLVLRLGCLEWALGPEWIPLCRILIRLLPVEHLDPIFTEWTLVLDMISSTKVHSVNIRSKCSTGSSLIKIRQRGIHSGPRAHSKQPNLKAKYTLYLIL